MTEVDSQCLRKGTTRMPQKILKQLLQTAGQHLKVLCGSVCLPLIYGVYPLADPEQDTILLLQFWIPIYP